MRERERERVTYLEKNSLRKLEKSYFEASKLSCSCSEETLKYWKFCQYCKNDDSITNCVQSHKCYTSAIYKSRVIMTT